MKWEGHVVSMGEVRNAYKISVGKWDIGVDGRIILRWILKEWRCEFWTEDYNVVFLSKMENILNNRARHFIENSVLIPLVWCYLFGYAKLRYPFRWLSAIKYENVLNTVLLDGGRKVGWSGVGWSLSRRAPQHRAVIDKTIEFNWHTRIIQCTVLCLCYSPDT